MQIPKTELAADIKRVYDLLNQPPTVNQYKKLGKYGNMTIKRAWGSWSNALLEVTGEVNVKPFVSEKIICPSCEKEFMSKFKDMKYCSRSCSNSDKPRRKKAMHTCKGCNNMIPLRSLFCEQCKSTGKHLGGGKFLKDKTIKEALYKSGANRFGTIRCHAHTVVKNRVQACCNCGYEKHVEIHHIKDISNFSLDTKISIVNHPENLVLLCRNCHWECSHGLLNLNKIGGRSGN